MQTWLLPRRFPLQIPTLRGLTGEYERRIPYSARGYRRRAGPRDSTSTSNSRPTRPPRNTSDSARDPSNIHATDSYDISPRGRKRIRLSPSQSCTSSIPPLVKRYLLPKRTLPNEFLDARPYLLWQIPPALHTRPIVETARAYRIESFETRTPSRTFYIKDYRGEEDVRGEDEWMARRMVWRGEESMERELASQVTERYLWTGDEREELKGVLDGMGSEFMTTVKREALHDYEHDYEAYRAPFLDADGTADPKDDSWAFYEPALSSLLITPSTHIPELSTWDQPAFASTMMHTILSTKRFRYKLVEEDPVQIFFRWGELRAIVGRAAPSMSYENAFLLKTILKTFADGALRKEFLKARMKEARESVSKSESMEKVRERPALEPYKIPPTPLMKDIMGVIRFRTTPETYNNLLGVLEKLLPLLQRNDESEERSEMLEKTIPYDAFQEQPLTGREGVDLLAKVEQLAASEREKQLARRKDTDAYGWSRLVKLIRATRWQLKWRYIRAKNRERKMKVRANGAALARIAARDSQSIGPRPSHGGDSINRSRPDRLLRSAPEGSLATMEDFYRDAENEEAEALQRELVPGVLQDGGLLERLGEDVFELGLHQLQPSETTESEVSPVVSVLPPSTGFGYLDHDTVAPGLYRSSNYPVDRLRLREMRRGIGRRTSRRQFMLKHLRRHLRQIRCASGKHTQPKRSNRAQGRKGAVRKGRTPQQKRVHSSDRKKRIVLQKQASRSPLAAKNRKGHHPGRVTLLRRLRRASTPTPEDNETLLRNADSIIAADADRPTGQRLSEKQRRKAAQARRILVGSPPAAGLRLDSRWFRVNNLDLYSTHSDQPIIALRSRAFHAAFGKYQSTELRIAEKRIEQTYSSLQEFLFDVPSTFFVFRKFSPLKQLAPKGAPGSSSALKFCEPLACFETALSQETRPVNQALFDAMLKTATARRDEGSSLEHARIFVARNTSRRLERALPAFFQGEESNVLGRSPLRYRDVRDPAVRTADYDRFAITTEQDKLSQWEIGGSEAKVEFDPSGLVDIQPDPENVIVSEQSDLNLMAQGIESMANRAITLPPEPRAVSSPMAMLEVLASKWSALDDPSKTTSILASPAQLTEEAMKDFTANINSKDFSHKGLKNIAAKIVGNLISSDSPKEKRAMIYGVSTILLKFRVDALRSQAISAGIPVTDSDFVQVLSSARSVVRSAIMSRGFSETLLELRTWARVRKSLKTQRVKLEHQLEQQARGIRSRRPSRGPADAIDASATNKAVRKSPVSQGRMPEPSSNQQALSDFEATRIDFTDIDKATMYPVNVYDEVSRAGASVDFPEAHHIDQICELSEKAYSQGRITAFTMPSPFDLWRLLHPGQQPECEQRKIPVIERRTMFRLARIIRRKIRLADHRRLRIRKYEARKRVPLRKFGAQQHLRIYRHVSESATVLTVSWDEKARSEKVQRSITTPMRVRRIAPMVPGASPIEDEVGIANGSGLSHLAGQSSQNVQKQDNSPLRSRWIAPGMLGSPIVNEQIKRQDESGAVHLTKRLFFRKPMVPETKSEQPTLADRGLSTFLIQKQDRTPNPTNQRTDERIAQLIAGEQRRPQLTQLELSNPQTIASGISAIQRESLSARNERIAERIAEIIVTAPRHSDSSGWRTKRDFSTASISRESAAVAAAVPPANAASSASKAEDQNKWSETLLLPASDFPARTSPKKIEELLKIVGPETHNHMLSRSNDGPVFCLHDGPPYANGDLHIGHALNKVLKDITIRWAMLKGHQVDYRTGWDCHGLPIEIKALEKWRATVNSADNERPPPKEIRLMAREHAQTSLSRQRQQFSQFGILTNFDQAWTTDDKPYQVNQLRVFQKLLQKGLIYRANRPVYWSPSSGTALAEAELEYDDAHTSVAAYIKFNLLPEDALRTKLSDSGVNGEVSIVIWTTTPWTIPANRAVAVGKDISYSVVQDPDRNTMIVATSLVDSIAKVTGTKLNVLEEIYLTGADLEGQLYEHPMTGVHQKILTGDFVSDASGTGLVHNAPGHGMEDYILGNKHNLEVFAPVDDDGRFTDKAYPLNTALLAGKSVQEEGNIEVIKFLKSKKMLLKSHKYKHSYPYDWRTKKPVITRATQQWFADVASIRETAVQALDSVKFVPEHSKGRLAAFIRSRSEWCISRQRAWGVPIPALKRVSDGEVILTAEMLDHIIPVFQERGFDAWWTDSEHEEAWVPPSMRDQGPFSRTTDTMDVWFDSGSSWMEMEPEKQADVYLEGSDQHRGWFQSSLLLRIAYLSEKGKLPEGVPGSPYKTLVTAGFVLDGQNKKMSKSIGNVIAPSEVMAGSLLPKIKRAGQTPSYDSLGPDALRLWVAMSDFRADVSVGSQVLKTVHRTLVKWRLTVKLLLGMIESYDPSQANKAILSPLDKLALIQLARMESNVTHAMDSFDYHRAVGFISNYINVDFSAFYMESVKDKVYADAPNNPQRQATLSVMATILAKLRQMLYPFCPLLVEECVEFMPKGLRHPSLLDFQHFKPLPLPAAEETANLEKYEANVHALHAAIKLSQEKARNEKVIGSSSQSQAYLELASDVTLGSLVGPYESELNSIFATEKFKVGDLPFEKSGVQESSSEPDRRLFTSIATLTTPSELAVSQPEQMVEGKVTIFLASGRKCMRCWQQWVYDSEFNVANEKRSENEDDIAICRRCEKVMASLR